MTASAPVTNPYLSVVVTSRNDDHGGNLKARMQYFVDGWIHQAKKFNLDSELVIVEWNPPQDRPRLKDALRWPDDLGPCVVRIIEVPTHIHHHFQHAEKLPLFQFIAKNVGLRRAWGDFVLATNIDILFSDEMMAFLAARKLDREKMYRNDRLDVPAELPEGLSMDETLDYCARNVIRINKRNCSINLSPPGYYAYDMMGLDAFALSMAEYLKTTCSILARLPGVAGGAYRLATQPGRASLGDRSRLAGRLFASLFAKFKEVRSANADALKKHKAFRRDVPPLHFNACGDFELMHAGKWRQIQGYPEYQGFSMHLDSLLLMGAVYSGLVEEEVLPFPMRHYHIEHSVGSGFTPEGEEALYERLRVKELPTLEWPECLRMGRKFKTSGQAVQFNEPDWGLAGAPLNETTL